MHAPTLKAAFLALALFAFPALAAPPDGLLTSRTKLALWTVAGVRSSTLHVDTNDAVVTLYGKLPSAEQKDLAEKTARQVGGVRGVNNLIQVVARVDEKKVNASDKELKAVAEKQLKASPSLKDSKIFVKSVDKGVALLSGDATTLSDHLRAVAIVDRIPGIRRVQSEVKSPDVFGNSERIAFVNDAALMPAPQRTSGEDMRTSAGVKLRLLTAAQVPSTEISVDTEDGVVTLFGIVPTAAVRNDAALEAGKAHGVVRVDNMLEVVASNQKAAVDAKDSDITRDLALASKDRADFKNVKSSVKNGIVQLTGTVESGWDEVSAVRVARRVQGVRGVEDQLKIDEPRL